MYFTRYGKSTMKVNEQKKMDLNNKKMANHPPSPEFRRNQQLHCPQGWLSMEALMNYKMLKSKCPRYLACGVYPVWGRACLAPVSGATCADHAAADLAGSDLLQQLTTSHSLAVYTPKRVTPMYIKIQFISKINGDTESRTKMCRTTFVTNLSWYLTNSSAIFKVTEKVITCNVYINGHFECWWLSQQRFEET